MTFRKVGINMKKIAWFLIGVAVLSLGVALTIKAGLGTSTWNAAYVGLSESTGMTIGTWSIIGYASLICINAWLSKKKLNWAGAVNIFIGGLMTDFWLLVVLKDMTVSSFAWQLAILLAGAFFFSLGIVTYLQAQFAKHPVDDLMLIVKDRFAVKLVTSKLLIDLAACAVALLVGGPIFLGTVFLFFATAPLIQWIAKAFRKMGFDAI